MDLPYLLVWCVMVSVVLVTEGRNHYFLSKSAFSKSIPAMIASVRVECNRSAHS